MKTNLKVRLLCVTLWCSIFAVYAQNPGAYFVSHSPDSALSSAYPTLFDYLSNHTSQLVLCFPMDSLNQLKKQDRFQKATMYFNAGDTVLTFDLRIKARGKNRRRICEFPPIELNFYDKKLNSYGVAGQGELKLVSHCFNDEQALEYLYREFLIYQMYNRLTENSFRVHWVEIIYKDQAAKRPPLRSFAFIIENTSELMKRLNGRELEQYGFKLEDMEQRSAFTLSLFQYMIGNADWKIAMQHNLKFLHLPEDSCRILIPYDFDCSGLVDAPYAVPNPDYPIRHVKNRIYLGPEPNEDMLAQTIKLFKTNESGFYEMVEAAPVLSDASKMQMKKYLKSFYKQLNKSQKIRAICRRSYYRD